MTTKMTITKSTASKNGGFILTLLMFDTVKSAFGDRKVERKLFKKNDTAIAVGTVLDVDLDQFRMTTALDTMTDESGTRQVAKTWIKEKTALDHLTDGAQIIDNRPVADARATLLKALGVGAI